MLKKSQFTACCLVILVVKMPRLPADELKGLKGGVRLEDDHIENLS